MWVHYKTSKLVSENLYWTLIYDSLYTAASLLALLFFNELNWTMETPDSGFDLLFITTCSLHNIILS